MTEHGRTVRSALSEASSGAPAGWRDNLTTGLALLATAAGLFLLWHLASSLLIIFAGVLFASFLHACARALEPVFPASRSWRLTLVIVILSALIILGILWGAGNLPEQTRYVVRVIDAQLDVLQTYLLNFGIEWFGPEGGRDFSQWFPITASFLGTRKWPLERHPVSWQTPSSSCSRNTLRVQPGHISRQHRSARQTLYRARARDVLNEMGAILQLWLVGQVVRILLMTICVCDRSLFRRPPGAFLLGLQARTLELHPVSRSDRRRRSDRPGGHAARPFDADLVGWHLHGGAIDRRIYCWPAHPASGCRNPARLDTWWRLFCLERCSA